MAKILVTGAAGFIGSQLSYALYKQGHEVVLLDNFSYGKEDNLLFEDKSFTDEILRADILDREYMDSLIKESHFDYIYHIAAITPLPDCQLDPPKAIETNVVGTINILEAARKYGVKKIIFSSTSAVYENTPVYPSKEDTVNDPHLIYSLGKYTAERFCRSYHEVYGMNVTVLRFANVYGPHLDCLRTQPPVAGYMIRELFFDRSPVLHSTGEQLRDFIYVDDLVDLAVHCMEGEGYDTFNVSSNETHSINEMYEIIRKHMGKDIPAVYTETSHYWERYPGLYEGAYPIKAGILEHEVLKYTLLDNSHGYERYGWKPQVSFEEGLKRTVDYSVKVLANV